MSLLVWMLYLPASGLIAFGGSLGIAVADEFAAACGQSSARVLLDSAAQESVDDALLGRVMGVISLVHRGAHATGLVLVAPLFAVLPARAIFAGAALALPVVGLAGATVALALEHRRSAASR